MLRCAKRILKPDKMTYHYIKLNTKVSQFYLEAMRINRVDNLVYFPELGELFRTLVIRGKWQR